MQPPIESPPIRLWAPHALPLADFARPPQTDGVGTPPGVPIPTPAEIAALVEAHERYAMELHVRMEDDWDLVTLKPFDAGEGYRSYTSNEPLTFFTKITAALTSGEVSVRVASEKSQKEERGRESAKERFVIGILKANDERLAKLGQPSLLEILASFVNLRGWYSGRYLLVKDPLSGETHVDITPWDPLHVSWGMGPSGLRWVCEHTKKTLADVSAEYPALDMAGLGQTGVSAAERYFSSPSIGGAEADGVDVYDWWDEQNNIVVANDQLAKIATPHGDETGVPAFFGAVGPMPLIQSRLLGGKNNLVYQGESIFAANRRIYDKLNLVYSTMLQLVALSRDQAYLLYSPSGRKTLPKNPALEGSVVSLATEDKLDLLPLLEMSKDTAPFLGLISGEVQRGALPYSVYGQLAFQLSGYAVNLLEQATDAPLLPRRQAIERCLTQIGNGICDQFATGAYGTLHLNGYTTNRDWFDEDFVPEMLQGLPAAEITLTVKTPRDELQALQMAKMLDEGLWPLADRRWIRDRVLHVQDVDAMDSRVKEQVAERLLPEAALMTLMVAAEEQGRPEIAMFYYGQLIKQGIILPPRPWMAGAGAGDGGGAAGGFSPTVLSAPEQGSPVPPATPQVGANVPPGSPRPGAQGQPV